MGYFNIFYKITRIIDMLTRKRNRKFIVAILVIIGIIFLLHNKGYCAQSDSEYTTDTTYFILEEYQGIINQFVKVFNMSYHGDVQVWSDNIDDFLDDIKSGKYPYFYKQNDQYIRIFMYDHTTSKTLIDTSLVYNDNFRVPSTAYNITNQANQKFYVMNTQSGGFTYNDSMGALNVTIPQVIWGRIPIEVVQCMSSAGMGYQNNQDIIDIKELIQQSNSNLEDINDSLTDTTYDEDVVDIDTSSVDSMSDTEVNGLFSTIVSNFNNALTMWNGTTSIIFYIPFTNGKYISIPDNIVSSKLPTQFLDLVHAFWYFVFGLYLFRFINNLIKKIRSGDILNGYSNDNEVITSNML